MLCRLLLMRHAKSSWPENVSDHERPLEARGINDASKIALQIKSLGYEPESVLCSDSVRTLETWSLMVETLGEHIPVQNTSKLYNSSTRSYIEAIGDLSFEGPTLLLIGHNPTIEELVHLFSGKSREMKPANVAVLEIHSGDWKNALSRHGTWKLVNLITC